MSPRCSRCSSCGCAGRGYVAELTAPLTIRTLDTDHVWTLTPRHDGLPFVAVRSEPGADLVEGNAVDLLRLLEARLTDHPGVSYVGNRDRIAAFREPADVMKIGLVGAGSVGATIAYACQIRGVAQTIAIYDIDPKKTRPRCSTSTTACSSRRSPR